MPNKTTQGKEEKKEPYQQKAQLQQHSAQLVDAQHAHQHVCNGLGRAFRQRRRHHRLQALSHAEAFLHLAHVSQQCLVLRANGTPLRVEHTADHGQHDAAAFNVLGATRVQTLQHTQQRKHQLVHGRERQTLNGFLCGFATAANGTRRHSKGGKLASNAKT